MSTTYRTNQRTVKVKVLSPRGWIYGTVYVGEINLFLDAINCIPCFINLADVSLQDGLKLSFLGVRLSAIQVIIPQEPENMIVQHNPAENVVKHVGCMLHSGSIEGYLNLAPDIRVSDYMHRRDKFFMLREAAGSIWQNDPGTNSEILPEKPSVLVNAQQVIGITEFF